MKKIAIIGTAGIGKTTVIKKLKELFLNDLKVHFYEEKEKYTYLEKAYKDMKKYALILQFDFLMSRLRMVNDDRTKKYEYVFFDRLYIDDYYYAKLSNKRGQISNEEFKMYDYCFKNFANITKADGNEIDLVIILRQSKSSEANSRRNLRNRFEGKEKNNIHFDEIDKYYDSNEVVKWLKKYSSKILTIKNSDSNKTAKKIYEEVIKL